MAALRCLLALAQQHGLFDKYASLTKCSTMSLVGRQAQYFFIACTTGQVL